MFTAELEGHDRLVAAIGAYQTAVKDLRPFFRDVFAPKYFAGVQDLFATEGRKRAPSGRFSGGVWPRLSPRYAAWKKVHFPGRKILEREGDLKKSLVWSGRRLGAKGIWDAHPDYVRFGTSVPYASYHQTGTATLPQRAFMDPPDPKVYAPLLKEWILRNARAGKK